MNEQTMTQEDLAHKVINGANSCGEHKPGFEVDDVAEVAFAWDSEPDDPTDREGWCIVRLKDGRWARAWDSEDYTGHGCRCSGGGEMYKTKGEAWRSVSAEELREAFVPGWWRE